MKKKGIKNSDDTYTPFDLNLNKNAFQKKEAKHKKKKTSTAQATPNILLNKPAAKQKEGKTNTRVWVILGLAVVAVVLAVLIYFNSDYYQLRELLSNADTYIEPSDYKADNSILNGDAIAALKKIDEDVDNEANLQSETVQNAVAEALGLQPDEIYNYHLLYIQKLDVAGLNLEAIDDAGKMVNLEILNINDNRISELPDFSDLKHLGSIYAARNAFMEIDDFAQISGLVYLYVSGNSITNITGIEKLKNLKRLDISNNYIRDISMLEALEHLEKLKIDGNPLDDTEENRAAVEALLYQGCIIEGSPF